MLYKLCKAKLYISFTSLHQDVGGRVKDKILYRSKMTYVHNIDK